MTPTPESAVLANCVCGGVAVALRVGSCGPFWVECITCLAHTPHYVEQALADAAWNRMMAEPDDKLEWRGHLSALKHADTEVRILLSALADELTRCGDSVMSNQNTQIGLSAAMVAICIDKVLADKPKP